MVLSLRELLPANPLSPTALPVFNGDDDAYGWVLDIDQFLAETKISSSSKLLIAALGLQGPPLQWWLQWSHHHPLASWESFIPPFLWHFKPEWQHLLPTPEEPTLVEPSDLASDPSISSISSTPPAVSVDLVVNSIHNIADNQKDLDPLIIPTPTRKEMVTRSFDSSCVADFIVPVPESIHLPINDLPSAATRLRPPSKPPDREVISVRSSPFSFVSWLGSIMHDSWPFITERSEMMKMDSHRRSNPPPLDQLWPSNDFSATVQPPDVNYGWVVSDSVHEYFDADAPLISACYHLNSICVLRYDVFTLMFFYKFAEVGTEWKLFVERCKRLDASKFFLELVDGTTMIHVFSAGGFFGHVIRRTMELVSMSTLFDDHHVFDRRPHSRTCDFSLAVGCLQFKSWDPGTNVALSPRESFVSLIVKWLIKMKWATSLCCICSEFFAYSNLPTCPDLLDMHDYVICSENFPKAWTEVSSIPRALGSIILRQPRPKFVIATLGKDGFVMLETILILLNDTVEVENILQIEVPSCISTPACVRSESWVLIGDAIAATLVIAVAGSLLNQRVQHIIKCSNTIGTNFLEETKDKSYVAEGCPMVFVLHPSWIRPSHSFGFLWFLSATSYLQAKGKIVEPHLCPNSCNYISGKLNVSFPIYANTSFKLHFYFWDDYKRKAQRICHKQSMLTTPVKMSRSTFADMDQHEVHWQTSMHFKLGRHDSTQGNLALHILLGSQVFMELSQKDHPHTGLHGKKKLSMGVMNVSIMEGCYLFMLLTREANAFRCEFSIFKPAEFKPWDPGEHFQMSKVLWSFQSKQWDPGKFFHRENFYNLEDKVGFDGIGIDTFINGGGANITDDNGPAIEPNAAATMPRPQRAKKPPSRFLSFYSIERYFPFTLFAILYSVGIGFLIVLASRMWDLIYSLYLPLCRI